MIIRYMQKNGIIAAFLVLVFLSLFFLIFQKGIWIYLDLAYEGSFLLKNSLSIKEILQSITSYTLFGFDNTQLFATRFINIFFEGILIKFFGNFSQIVYFLFYFCINFFLAKKCFNFLFPEKASYLGAFLFTFNPVSLYLLNEAGFFFVYFSLPLIVYSAVSYFRSEKIAYFQIFLFGIGISLLTSYARVSFVYTAILVGLAAVFWREIAQIFFKQKKKLFILAGLSFLIFAPIFFSFLHPKLSGDDRYFSGISNYSRAFIRNGESAYRGQLRTELAQSFILTELTSNFADEWQDSRIFKGYSWIYGTGILFLTIFFLGRRSIKKEHSQLMVLFLGLFSLGVYLRALAHFTGKVEFIEWTYKRLPFLANTSSWVMIGMAVILAGLAVFIWTYANRKERFWIMALSLFYIILSIFPLVIFSGNIKLRTISAESLPEDYELFWKQEEPSGTLFFPGKNLYFDWAPYPVDISQGKFFKDVFSNNVRLVNEKQARLYDYLNNLLNGSNLSNAYFFNVKDVFVFKGIRNDEEGFDYFAKKNYIQLAERYLQEMRQEKDFEIQEENSHFTRFVSKINDQANFSVYSPREILPLELDSFFQQGRIDVKRRGVLVDSSSFQKPKNIPTEIDPEVRIHAKAETDNASKYLIKIERKEKEIPFMLQLNQTFGVTWKIKWVDKEYYDYFQCRSDWRHFSLSNNSFCRTDFPLWDWRDWGLLMKADVSPNRHFEGNFVGNAWIVYPEDIPESLKGDKEIYGVLVYEKQIYYIWIVLLSAITMLFLVAASLINQIKERYLTKKNVE